MKYLLVLTFLISMCAATSAMSQDTIHIKTVKTTAVDPKNEPLIVVRADSMDYEVENASLDTINPD